MDTTNYGPNALTAYGPTDVTLGDWSAENDAVVYRGQVEIGRLTRNHDRTYDAYDFDLNLVGDRTYLSVTDAVWALVDRIDGK